MKESLEQYWYIVHAQEMLIHKIIVIIGRTELFNYLNTWISETQMRADSPKRNRLKE